jgi:hypothetical protein
LGSVLMYNGKNRALTPMAVAVLLCAVCTLTPRTILAQFIQRIAREERLPARREAQTFRQVTRAEDSAFRQTARRDEQLGRRSAWNRETHFRSERRRSHREKINRTRAQEQVIRTDRANFNLAQTKQRQAVHQNTAKQRREQTLRISREIRETNIARQRADRERIEEVRDTIRSELQQIRQGTRPTSR